VHGGGIVVIACEFGVAVLLLAAAALAWALIGRRGEPIGAGVGRAASDRAPSVAPTR
jgi:hypothetical protein